jgi:general secretion pathway protein J
MRRPSTGGNRRAGGFTLIELLVAIGILAIVAVLGWRGLDGIVRARIALTQQMEQTRGMQLAFAQMQSDAEHLADARLLHQRQNLQVDNGQLTLVRTVFAENEATRVQVVAYRVRDGVLTRRESNATRDLIALDALWQAALNGTDAGTDVVLQTGVAGMGLRLWQGREWSLAAGATASAIAQAAAQAAGLPAVAPTGLEVALQLQGQQTSMIKVFLLGAL